MVRRGRSFAPIATLRSGASDVTGEKLRLRIDD
jgi:hypothetical protein